MEKQKIDISEGQVKRFAQEIIESMKKQNLTSDGVTRILEIVIYGVFNEVKKGFK